MKTDRDRNGKSRHCCYGSSKDRRSWGEGQDDRFLNSSPGGATPEACLNSATLWRRLFGRNRHDAQLTRLNEQRKVCGQPLLDQSVVQTVKHRRAGGLIHVGSRAGGGAVTSGPWKCTGRSSRMPALAADQAHLARARSCRVAQS